MMNWGFDKVVEDKLKHFISSIQNSEIRKVAVFDADGTLWKGDIGEVFFQWQVSSGKLELEHKPPEMKKDENLWDFYLRHAISSGTAAMAYGWLAQWNFGKKESVLIAECDEFFEESWKLRVFSPMKNLIQFLESEKIEVWVVSGSMKWIVASGAKYLGIPSNRVLGSCVQVEKEILTHDLAYEVPYRAGKARLIESQIQCKPVLAAGNTYWDKEMLSVSSGIRLAIHSEHPGELNFDSEQKLKELALQEGWLVQKF